MTKPLLLSHDKSPKYEITLRSPYGDPDKCAEEIARMRMTAVVAEAICDIEDNRNREYYVVGRCDIYDPELAAQTLVKKGRDTDYVGGSVFMTPSDAAHVIFEKPDWAIYVIRCKPEDFYLLNGCYHLVKSIPVLRKWESSNI